MADYILETKNLTKTFRHQTVVEGVSLAVRRGSVYGLLGAVVAARAGADGGAHRGAGALSESDGAGKPARAHANAGRSGITYC